jgi:hypothetical protein
MTRRLGGTRKSLAAIASLSLAVTLACMGATGCGSSTSNTGSPPEAGLDGFGFEGGEDAPITTIDSGPTPVIDSGPVEAAPPPVVLGTPTFMPASGTVLTGPTNVTIVPPANFPASGFIYYTTNGTNPNPNSLVYAGPIQVSQNETIRAYASAPGYTDSMVGVATYTVSVVTTDAGEGGPPPALSEPALSPSSSVQNNDFKVAASSTTPGTTICYTLDGVTMPTCSNGACTGSSLQYNSVTQIAINGGVTSSDGSGTVLVQAITCEAGAGTSPVASQKYTLQVAAPFFSNPGPGTVLLGVTPIVQSTTTGATIAYTKGTGAPTCINGTAGVGTAVSDPHTIAATSNDALNASTTYQTIGCKAGYAPSTVSISPFVVQLNALTFPATGNGAPGTYDVNVAPFTFGDGANGNATATQWACYTLDSTPPACGATTAGTCAAGTAGTGGAGLTTAASISTTGTVVTVIDCALGYTSSAAATGTFTLKLDPPDLTPPGVANGAPVTSYAIPANKVGSLTATVGQDGTGQAYGFVCVLKSGTPQCGAGACTAGTQVALGATIPPTGTIVPGDSWSVIGCPAQTINFLPSAVTTVSFSGPGVASAPQIAPASGTFANPIAPTITNTDTTASGTTICFTEDGTTPTCTAGTCGGTGVTSSQLLAPAGGATVPADGISIGLPGSGYTTAPAISLTGGGATTNAIASATLYITGYTLTNGGSGYSASDGDFTCIPITDAHSGGGSGAFVDATLTGGSISSLSFDNGCGGSNGGQGSGYITPVITLPKPVAATGTRATATLTGSLYAITVTSGGAGYSTPPAVGISGGGGATAIAVTTNTLQVGVSLTACGGTCPGTALQTNTVNTIQATACNATEVAPAPVSGSYTFALAQPDFTLLGGVTGNLNSGVTTISAGQQIVITTASTFSGEVIDVSYGSTAPTCATGVHQPTAGTDGLPGTTANGVATVSGGGSIVTVTVPTGVAAFTVNAIACGSATTVQNTSAPRGVSFETVSTATPTLTTNEVVAVAGVAGCAAAPCQPTSPWYNTFNVTLSDATPGATICYSTSGGVTPACTGGGACNAGLTYTAPIPITVSGTPVLAWACATTTGLSGNVSTSFVLDVSPVVAFSTGTCGAGGTITMQFSPGAPGSQVSDAVASLGGATDDAVICWTNDGNDPGSTTGANGDTTCSAANGSIVDPTSTTPTGAISGPFTLTYQAFLNGFQSQPTTLPISPAAYRHSGTITLDGVFGDWTSASEENGNGYFTYDNTNLYFGTANIDTGVNTAVAIYVGTGVAGTGATTIPANLGGNSLAGFPGTEYVIEWVTSPGSAAPTVQAWTNGSGWAPVSVAVNFGSNVTNPTGPYGAEFSVPLASLPLLGTPGPINVLETESFNVGSAHPSVSGIASFETNYSSCTAPND